MTLSKADQILDDLYAVLHSLQAIHTLGAGENTAYSDTPSYHFAELAGVLGTRLADPTGDLEQCERDELSLLLGDLFEDIRAGIEVLPCGRRAGVMIHQRDEMHRALATLDLLTELVYPDGILEKPQRCELWALLSDLLEKIQAGIKDLEQEKARPGHGDPGKTPST